MAHGAILSLGKQVLTPWQHAVLEVACVPYRPDLQAICAALAAMPYHSPVSVPLDTASSSRDSSHSQVFDKHLPCYFMLHVA